MRPRVRGPISTVDHDAGHPVRQVARQRVPDAGAGPRGTPAEVVPVRQITGGRVDEPGNHLPRRPPSAPGRRRHRSRTAAPPKVGRHRQHHAAPGSPGEFLRHDSFLSSWRTSATGDSTDEDLRVQAQTSHPNRTSPVLRARWLLPPNRTTPRSATAVRRRNRGGSWGSGRAESWVSRGAGRSARRWRPLESGASRHAQSAWDAPARPRRRVGVWAKPCYTGTCPVRLQENIADFGPGPNKRVSGIWGARGGTQATAGISRPRPFSCSARWSRSPVRTV